jgi:hypothetical protein
MQLLCHANSSGKNSLILFFLTTGRAQEILGSGLPSMVRTARLPIDFGAPLEMSRLGVFWSVNCYSLELIAHLHQLKLVCNAEP